MADSIVIRRDSQPLSKAYQANVQQDIWNRRIMLLTDHAPTGDGVFVAGDGGSTSPELVFLFPYAEAEPGTPFWMRVYGWRSISQYQRTVWVYFILAEFLCVTGSLPGPVTSQTGAPNPGVGLPIRQTENMAAMLSISAGYLGRKGFINALTGAPAFAALELQGSQLIQFDFVQPAGEGATVECGMNCLWAVG